MKKSSSFYVEVLALLFVLLLTCTLLVQMFGASAQMSRNAANLTQAVALAQNAAERFAAEKTAEVGTTAELFDANGSALESSSADEAAYIVYTAVRKDDTYENLFRADITVYCRDEEMYTLQTAKYLQTEEIL